MIYFSYIIYNVLYIKNCINVKRNLNLFNFYRMLLYYEICFLKRNMEYIYILIKVKYLELINFN